MYAGINLKVIKAFETACLFAEKNTLKKMGGQTLPAAGGVTPA
jgi:hypothetical protein